MNELLGSTPDHADWERLRPLLDAAMHELKARDRAAVLLRFFEKRSFADVGRHLGLGENAARMSVERALNKLGGLLARRGITSSSAALSLALTQQAVKAAPAGMAATVASAALGQAALVGSAGVGTVLASFMANTKLTLCVAALAGLLAIGTGIITETRWARMTEELAGLAQETAAVTGRAQEIEARLAARAETEPVGPTAVVAPSPAAQPAETKRDEYLRAALSDPASIRLFAQLHRVDARRRYAALYRQLGWTATQVEQFEMILEASTVDDLRSQGGAEIKDGALTLTLEIASQLERIRAEFENRVRVTFGEAALQQFQAFEHTSPARAVADDVARRVYLSATPLTAGQADELVRILEVNTAASDPGRTLRNREMTWDQVLTQAQDVLAPAQLKALRAVRLKAELDTALFPEAKR